MNADRLPDFPIRLQQRGGHRSGGHAAVVNVDAGKYAAAIAVCAVCCGICTAISFTLWRHAHDDLVDVQDEKQKERNHVIELQARLDATVDELRELKHHER